MTNFLYKVIELIAVIHNYILTLNDKYEYNFTDKELHFLVIGLLGMGLILITYPVLRYLIKRNHIMTVTFIYVFSEIIVLSFAIEIGQKVTNTGKMEFKDILFGITGFLAMYIIFNIGVYGIKFIKKLLKEKTSNKTIKINSK